jgi:hypothetical protein
MWVQEIEFDSDSDTCLNEGDVNQIGEVSLDELLAAAKTEYGDPIGNVVSPDDENTNIGWKFKTTASYDDIEDSDKASFTLETWIIVHEKPPEINYFYAPVATVEVAATPGQDQLTIEP